MLIFRIGLKYHLLQFIFTLSYSLLLLELSAQPIQFKEVSQSIGIGDHANNYGMALCDYDGDGLEDIYVSRRSGENKLYKNLGQMRFEELAKKAGVNYSGGTRTSIWADFDNDGFPELYLGNDRSLDILYRNNANGSFTDISKESGIINPFNTFSVNVSDVNLDGLLDIYISNFRDENVLYLNQGNLKFSLATHLYKLTDPQKSMANIFFDYDNDGDQDLYLVHDGYEPNILMQNQLTPPFLDRSEISKTNYSGQGMGVDAADINNDGWMDIYITNLFENVLLLNNGDGSFKDITLSSGVGDIGMGWGVSFADVDNDGFVDIYVCNDSHFSPHSNKLFRNKGDLSFEEISVASKVADMQGSYACICGDLDLDGNMDLLVANTASQDRVQIYQNLGTGQHWIGFKLEGDKANRQAIGARISFKDEHGMMHYDEITGGNGFAGQNSQFLHFGIAKARQIEDLKIYWSNKDSQAITSLKSDQYYLIKQGHEPISFKDLTTASDELTIEREKSLEVFPNPIDRQSELYFILDEKTKVRYSIWNLNGQKIFESYEEHLEKGVHVISPKAVILPQNVYIIRFNLNNKIFLKKIVLKN